MAKFDPDAYIKANDVNAGNFDPDAYIETHGKTSPAVSAVRKGLQGATAGFSDEAAGGVEALGRALGIEGAGGPMKDIHTADGGPTANWDAIKSAYELGRNRERAALARDSKDNPTVSKVAEFGGALASPVNKILPGSSLLKQGAAIGAITGLGNSDADGATEMAKDVAGGAAIGGLLGGTFDVGKSYLAKRAVNAAAQASKQSQALETVAEPIFKYKAPQSLEELSSWNPKVNAGALPGKTRLQAIEQIVPDLETKPLKYHFDMMENPKSMKELKLQFENLPTKDAQKIAAYNQQIVEESADKIKNTIANIAGGEPKNLTDAGYDFIHSVKDKYNSEKEALGPLFQKIQAGGGKLNPQESQDLIQSIGANTKVGKLLEVNPESGVVSLGPNAPRSGLSDSEHGILSRVVDDLNKGMSFKELQSTRDFLRKAIDPANPAASEEISKVRSIMLGQLENLASKKGPDVGETFKAYAKNERARESIEKIIGGKIESLDSMFSANPDKAVQKVFSNPNYVKVVGEYLGPQKMNEMVGSFLNNGVNKAMDPAKGFQPEKLRAWLKSNESFVRANVPRDVAERLSALADYGYYGKRFLDEVNPSGTAASLKAMLEPGSFVSKVKKEGIYGALAGEATERAGAFTKQRQAVKAINESLGQKAAPTIGERFAPALSGVDSLAAKATAGQAAAASVGSRLFPPAADKDNQQVKAPTKGPEKWVQDGLQKIKSHDQSGALKDQAALDQIMQSKKGRDLLVQASDLKVGSKAMDKIYAQLISQYNKGGG